MDYSSQTDEKKMEEDGTGKEETVNSVQENAGEQHFTVDTELRTSVTEGKADILFPSSRDVFYNPVQEFNRDLSIAVLRLFAEDHFCKLKEKRLKEQMKGKNEEPNMDEGICQNEDLKPGVRYEDGIRILEALSASGLRSVRYAKEVPGVKEIIANDLSLTAVNTIEANVRHNEVEHLVTTSHSDATLLMYKHRRYSERFHAVDLDPYGCPSPFLDGSVQCVQDGGLLLVTCTDMAVLAGNSPETCYTKYGAVSLKSKACHEMALRIVLQCIESHANRYGRHIVPLLSISADFYVRVFVKIFTSQATCKYTTSKLAHVYQCMGCETFTLQPLGCSKQIGEKRKFGIPAGPPVAQTCTHCGFKHHMGGPIWTGQLHDQDFVTRLEDLVTRNESEFGTERRMKGVLAVVREELPDIPLYYTVGRLCSIVRTETVPMLKFRSALLNAGHRVSLSHACRTSVKTDAPAEVIWDIMRRWEQDHPVHRDKLQSSSPVITILSQKPRTDISFTPHPNANPPSRLHGLSRFQENPAPFWGPGARARTSINCEKVQDRRKKNQGKRNRSESKHRTDEERKKKQKDNSK